ncbi:MULTISPECIES: adenylate/guanylate cyclase domain-containing protein [Mycobacterium]|uniref:Adenylate/guanylate cyclase domain-containing protein n=1 Tax=Mycobacterium kiyosense TaxID=2871094 RepID=A0A9P3QBP9_9MYCO|nr:adenylate/guanylate cyclase domain-containing protein [Mycobacterium kiyosense]BDE13846.1 adenylate/guanylate cyclase domain-containing protein [Mycobacterium sp. 20KCMC460]GLB83735.1 adenylate/guanylate cyclase domain-containing protein [Mycobacterium kiyosense]GLB91382.1 adenylate/guanylate cyclase domain-containing protein [Mycobacterium kiyosense]GLB97257.1 adenylate/guanylate cyclase domain-containing protein [Mycobacterium kiyosense]
MTSPSSTDEIPVGDTPRPGRRWRRPLVRPWFSLQSKVMAMLLIASLTSLGVIGVVGYVAARNALLPSASERMTQLRELQKRGIETLFTDLANSLVVYSRGSTALEAVQAFTAGFDQLATAPVDPAQQQALVDYYNNRLIQPVESATGTKLDLDALLPTNNSQRYLQAHYSVQPNASELDDAGDGSAWSAANARFNEYFRLIATRFEYRDALLLDARGNVVYSVRKNASLGTNIVTGPYRQSNLRGAYERAMGANSANFVWITDFQPYQAQLGQPLAWLVAPIGPPGKAAGVLALPLPIAKVNRIMTADRNWRAAGMGETGETYLAGPDSLMRSDSRLFLEDPQRYRTEAIAAGTRADIVDEAIRWRGTTLVQPVATQAVRAAQRGETGTMIDTDYLGRRELVAYAPLSLPNSDLHWSVLASRETSEANARFVSLTQTLVIATAAMVFVICVGALLVAQIFVRPIRRLQNGTREISAGNYEVAIPVTSRDEIGELTDAFNDMSRNLQIKEDLLSEQRKENDRLLGSLMPEPVAQRYREGEQTIAQEHQDVTVIFADFIGLDEISSKLPGEELVSIVDDLIQELDAAAEALGVEPIRTLHNGYLASCGLNFPRLDSVHRTVEFAVEMQDIIERFNSKTGYHLALRAGINTGHVISGLVGRSSIVYDMWGAAVNLAHSVRGSTSQAGIYVTTAVYEAMGDIRQFAPAGTVTVAGTEQQIWRLAEER